MSLPDIRGCDESYNRLPVTPPVTRARIWSCHMCERVRQVPKTSRASAPAVDQRGGWQPADRDSPDQIRERTDRAHDARKLKMIKRLVSPSAALTLAAVLVWSALPAAAQPPLRVANSNSRSVLLPPEYDTSHAPTAADLWDEPEPAVVSQAAAPVTTCGSCDGACSSWCSPRWYGQVDTLIWWAKGNNVPALVSTSPDGTARADAGVLGRPGTQVLHGGESIDGNYRPGLRFVLGYWLDDCQTLGVDATWFSLGDGANSGNYYAQSVGSPLSPILTRPFYNVLLGQQDSQLVAFPGVVEGDVQVATSSEMHSLALLLRRNVWQECGNRLDVVGGYRYFRYREGLTIQERLNVTDPGGAVAVGTTFDIRDSFSTENDFHGGELGLSTVFQRDCWSLDVLTKIAIGNMHQNVNIEGSNVVAPPNQTPLSGSGGFLALSTNMGGYNRNDFAVLPELNMNLRYCYSESLSLALGYSLLWITDVSRSGDQIDASVNVSQLPANGNSLIGDPRPAPQLGSTTMWVQGINLGLVWKY